MRKYTLPILMLLIFETVAVTLWLTKDNLFYLFNFSYIGILIYPRFLNHFSSVLKQTVPVF